jgi:RecA/RadA recombinase
MNKLFKHLKKINPLSSMADEGILSDIDYYIDSGSYALNALLSGSIYKGFPGNRIVGFAGPPTAGKTYLTISILSNYQKMANNHYVIYYDSEGRLTTEKLIDAGIVPDLYFHSPIRTLEQFKTEIIRGLSEIKKEVGFGDLESKKEVEDIEDGELLEDEESKHPEKIVTNDKDQFFLVLDSLSQLGSDKEETDAIKGDLKADMGARARTIKSIFRNITMDLNILKYPMIVTSHTYDSFSQYEPSRIAGGSGLQFAASIIIECLPTKDSVKTLTGREVIGTKIRCVLRKGELTKQWKQANIKVNFSNGLDRFAGLFDIAFNLGAIEREGKKYIMPDGSKWSLADIEEFPEKCFSEESLKKIDEYIIKDFTYGKNDKMIDTKTDEERVKEETQQETKESGEIIEAGIAEDDIEDVSKILTEGDPDDKEER